MKKYKKTVTVKKKVSVLIDKGAMLTLYGKYYLMEGHSKYEKIKIKSKDIYNNDITLMCPNGYRVEHVNSMPDYFE